MYRPTVTLTTNVTNQEIFRFSQKRERESYRASFELGGTYGGGTITISYSLSGGTVINPLLKQDLTAFSSTSAQTVNVEIPAFVQANEVVPQVILYISMTGATSPNFKLTVIDNT